MEISSLNINLYQDAQAYLKVFRSVFASPIEEISASTPAFPSTRVGEDPRRAATPGDTSSSNLTAHSEVQKGD